jgi:hypothetical protein
MKRYFVALANTTTSTPEVSTTEVSPLDRLAPAGERELHVGQVLLAEPHVAVDLSGDEGVGGYGQCEDDRQHLVLLLGFGSRPER